jgi:hypothetical protein
MPEAAYVRSCPLTGRVADIAETARLTHLGHRLPLLAAMHRPDLL